VTKGSAGLSRENVWHEQSAVISRPRGNDTDLADWGSLRSQRPALRRLDRADDCSLLVFWRSGPPHRGGSLRPLA